MLKKLVLIAVATVVLAGFISCDILGGATGVKGKLILEPGQTGDVRNARVELYEKSDLTGDPVKYGQSSSEGTDQSGAEFEIADVLSGYYYLLAWKDMDGDGDISGGDLVGVNDGSYTPGEGGQQLTIEDGKMTDVGDIKMYVYEGVTTGSIQVNSTPTGATIYLDGSSTGKTSDVVLTDVSADSHTVKLVKSGYNDWQQTVTVTAGQTITIDATLTPESGGEITSISVSGSLEDYIEYSGYYLNVVFTHDQTWDDSDYEDYTEVGLSFSNVTFSVPSEYQDGCYVIFWADECAYLEGIGDPYLAEWVFGFYGDQGGGEYSFLGLQENYTGIYISVEWYLEDGCPYGAANTGPRPDWINTKRIPEAR